MVEFNKKLMLDNISYLLSKRDMKIGELESRADVSTGYLARLSKDENSKPGVELVMKMADALGVSIDSLLQHDYRSLTPTESYLLKFLGKLRTDTLNDKLDWQKESADSLNRWPQNDDGTVDHPMLSYETFWQETEVEYPNEVSRVVFVSKSYGCNTYICGDCFKLGMEGGYTLYLMNIMKDVCNIKEKDTAGIELWTCSPVGEKDFICATTDHSALSFALNGLHNAVEERAQYPRLKKGVKNALDAFMES